MTSTGSTPPRPVSDSGADSNLERADDILAVSLVVLFSAKIENGRITPDWVSGNVTSVLGYTPAEALSPGWWWSNLHPEDSEHAGRAAAALLEQTEYTHEYRFRHANGTFIWILDQLRLVDTRSGVGSIVGSWTNVSTARKRQEQLESAERHYRRLVQTSPYGIYALDAEGRFTELNEAGERLLGRSDVLGTSFTDVVAAEDLERTVGIFDRIMSGTDDHLELELHVRTPEDERRLLLISITGIREDGITGVHGIARDITAEHRIADERERARLHYERLVTTSPYAIYALDMEGRFTEVNHSTVTILGYSAEELIGRPFSTLVAPEDLQRAAESFARKISDVETTTEMDLHLIRADGARRLAHIHATQIRDGDRVLGSHGIGRDITDEVARGEQLRRAERLATVGTLVAGVAHELNNPLTAIAGFAELMLLEPRSDDDREMLRLTVREAKRAAKIVSDLRVLARESQNAAPTERGPTDLNDIVRHVLTIQRYTLDTGNIQVVEELAPDLPAVHGNASELEQVVLNLVVNARQSLDQPGTSERRLMIRTSATAAVAVLYVADNGPGIPREHLERIFDPFFTTKSPGEGMGLGLSLVHSILTEHEGQLRVESSPGAGATFIVTLPLAHPMSQPAAAVPDSARGADLRILIVDDEEPIRRALLRYLTRRGHTVDAAGDGVEALSHIEQHEYDVILTDLRMPGMGGEQLVDTVRERDPQLARRMMFMTGHISRGDQSVGEHSDVPVVEKPFSLTEVGRRVEEHAARMRSR